MCSSDTWHGRSWVPKAKRRLLFRVLNAKHMRMLTFDACVSCRRAADYTNECCQMPPDTVCQDEPRSVQGSTLGWNVNADVLKLPHST